MEQDIILKDSIFKIGKVTSVEGRTVKVKVDKTKNTSNLLYKGKLLKDYPNINKILAYYTLDQQNAHLVFIADTADFHVVFDKELYDQIYSDFHIVLTKDDEYLLIDDEWVRLFFEKLSDNGDN